jgi:hypothetical protein
MITLKALSKFLGEGSKMGAPPKDANALCPIPNDVPDLPAIFQPRDGPLRALISSLVDDTITNVSLTAPNKKKGKTISSQGKVSSQGMGGCGKTTVKIIPPFFRSLFD